uniref:Dynein heavy chain n=1 Tax=Timema tahoe TaxID=61484 RepID=A0A7R9FI15_9NEOP|nr:unnamed protein product [Timema tahoe]
MTAQEMLPWLKFVHGDMFCDKHWMEMFALIGLPSKPVESLTFGDFLATKDNIIARANDLQIYKIVDLTQLSNCGLLKELNGRAVSEIAIRQALRELDIWEVEAKFSLTEHKDSREQSVMLIKDFKDILNKVGDNQCLLQSIKNSANYNSFIDRASIWETRLADLDQHLHNLNLIQRKWVYLEPIFGAGTMSQDQARFQRVDHDFRYIMADVSRDSKVVSLCRISNLHQILSTLLDQLSRCQKSLNDFLELCFITNPCHAMQEKRSAFPRFYFLGDEDLLEILGQSTKPRVIQAHLKKLFVGIHSVTFDPSEQHITAIRSLEGETVPLKQHVELTAKVELLIECVSDVEQTKSEPDPIKFPSQVLCLCESVLFTRRCEEAITNNSLQHLLGSLKHQLEAYTSLEVEWTDTPGDTEGDSKDLELKLKAMLLDTIHHMSVVEHLLAASVRQVNSWHWQRQLRISEGGEGSSAATGPVVSVCCVSRFYLRKDGVAVVRMVDAEFDYTYEYQGNATKLVHTPLTDKCYLTLTQVTSVFNCDKARLVLVFNYDKVKLVLVLNCDEVRLDLFFNYDEVRLVLVFNCDEVRLVLVFNCDEVGLVLVFNCDEVRLDLFFNYDEVRLVLVFNCDEVRLVLVFNWDEGIDVKSMARIFVGLVKCGAWGCFDEFNRLEETTLSAVSMQIQPIQTALKNHHTTVRLMDQEIPLDVNSGIFVTLNPVGKGYGGRQKLPDNLKQLFRPVVMSRPDNELIAEVILYCEGFKHAKTIGKKLVEVFDMARKLLSVQQHYDWGLRALKTVLGGCGSVLKAARKSGISVAQLDKEAEMELALRLNTLSKLTFVDCAGFDGIVRDMFPGIRFTSSGYEALTAALKESYTEFGLLYNESQLRKCVELYEQLQQRMGVVIVGPSGSGKTTLCLLLKSAILRLGGQVKQHTINPKAMPRSQLLGHIDLDTRQWTDGVLTLSAQQVYSEPPEVHSWVVCDGDVDPEWIESLNSVLDDNRLLTLPSGWRIQFGPNVNFIFETHDLSYASPATVSRMGIIFLSDEDINVEGLVFAWLNTQPEDTSRFLAQLIEDNFYKAVHWISQQGELVVTTSLVGVVMNGLSQLHGVSTRAHFTVALVQGLGGNLSLASREVFAKQVFQWTSEFVPDNIRLLYACYNHTRDCVDSYSMSCEDEHLHLDTYRSSLPLVMTADVKRTVDVLWTWLEPDSRQPFLLVGPQGCGKRYNFVESHEMLML